MRKLTKTALIAVALIGAALHVQAGKQPSTADLLVHNQTAMAMTPAPEPATIGIFVVGIASILRLKKRD